MVQIDHIILITTSTGYLEPDLGDVTDAAKGRSTPN